MPFITPTVYAGLVTAGSVKFAVAQPNTTQFALLYSVEVSCQNGFSADPEADIFVFSNPKAAEAFVKTLKSDFSWDSPLRTIEDTAYNSNQPGRYLITAQRAAFPANYIAKTPIGIPGCAWAKNPQPFTTNTSANPYSGASYLTIVIVFRSPDAVSDSNINVRANIMYQ